MTLWAKIKPTVAACYWLVGPHFLPKCVDQVSQQPAAKSCTGSTTVTTVQFDLNSRILFKKAILVDRLPVTGVQ